jgi:protein subunit release factor B
LTVVLKYIMMRIIHSVIYDKPMIFPVSPQKARALVDRMARLGINENDLQESFVRSGGKGGQNVNRVSTCVYLKHLPTGIEVKCQKERSQALNRYIARSILAAKIEEMLLGRESEERKRIEKIRRQKRKRSRRAKMKILRDKRIQSDKKKLRSGVTSFDE